MYEITMDYIVNLFNTEFFGYATINNLFFVMLFAVINATFSAIMIDIVAVRIITFVLLGIALITAIVMLIFFVSIESTPNAASKEKYENLPIKEEIVESVEIPSNDENTTIMLVTIKTIKPGYRDEYIYAEEKVIGTISKLCVTNESGTKCSTVSSIDGDDTSMLFDPGFLRFN